MITSEEYGKAMYIVLQYKKQLSREAKKRLNRNGETEIEEWLDSDFLISIKLCHGLIWLKRDKRFAGKYIENLTEKDFIKSSHLGKRTWNEFVKLRGY
jgi:hypothetical protein